jgi:hypothetical protein
MVWQVPGRSAGQQPALRGQDDRLTPAGGQKCHLRRHGQTSQGIGQVNFSSTITKNFILNKLY